MLELNPPTADASALLERARGYPYAAPAHSYVYRDGRVTPFSATALGGRTPVLAIGSNRAPRRLREKFGDHAEIPVEQVTLHDFDVAYSAHVTSYGAVPAMLIAARGARAALAVNWLTPDQLESMHESETRAANYRFAELPGAHVVRDDGTALAPVRAYLSTHGSLRGPRGTPIALAAIRCAGRRHAAMDTAAALEWIRQQRAPGEDADQFVLALIRDPARRRAMVESLAADAGAFAGDHRWL